MKELKDIDSEVDTEQGVDLSKTDQQESKGRHKNMLKQYLDLFLVFLKIGTFTFGGGFAMIPLIEREIVTNNGWIESEDILDLFAISQSIPGAIAINTSTLVGYKIAGKRGALFATIGVVLPSFIIITSIASFFSSIGDNPNVGAIFTGINAAVIFLIINAALRMMKTSLVDKLTITIFAITLILILVTDITPIILIIAGAIPGTLSYLRKGGSWL